jgi:hypothetical protein
MQVLRDPAAVAALQDPELRQLLDERFRDLCQDAPYHPDRDGYFVVVEPGDTVEAVEEQTGCPIVHDLFGEARFGEADFSPAFEWLAEHPHYFEVAYILNDDGFGVGVFVPRQPGIDPDLLALCAAYASPVPEPEPT